MHVDTINDALEERDSTFHCIPRRCQLATSRSCCKDYVQRCWKRSSLELCGLKLELYSSLRYLGTLTRPVRMRSAPSRSTNLQPSQNAHNVSQYKAFWSAQAWSSWLDESIQKMYEIAVSLQDSLGHKWEGKFERILWGIMWPHQNRKSGTTNWVRFESEAQHIRLWSLKSQSPLDLKNNHFQNRPQPLTEGSSPAHLMWRLLELLLSTPWGLGGTYVEVTPFTALKTMIGEKQHDSQHETFSEQHDFLWYHTVVKPLSWDLPNLPAFSGRLQPTIDLESIFLEFLHKYQRIKLD
jgi:hypothetical protein